MIDGQEVTERAFFQYMRFLSGNIESWLVAGISIFSLNLLENTLSKQYSYFDFTKTQSDNLHRYRSMDKKKYKLKLKGVPTKNDDEAHARFRDGKFIGWVMQSYLDELESKEGKWAKELHLNITNELIYKPPSENNFISNSFEEIKNNYAQNKSYSTSMKAPTVSKINGNASLDFDGLRLGSRFDVNLKNKNWNFFGPDRRTIYPNFQKNNILTTTLSRVQPLYGNIYTPDISDFLNINGTLILIGIEAFTFEYTLTVPVIR